MASTENELEKKSLIEWAEESLFSDQVIPFLQFCKQDYHYSDDMMSYNEFVSLKRRFEE